MLHYTMIYYTTALEAPATAPPAPGAAGARPAVAELLQAANDRHKSRSVNNSFAVTIFMIQQILSN